MNSLLGWMLGLGFVAVAMIGVLRRRWFLAGIYAITAIGTFVFLVLGGELNWLLNALTLIFCALLPGIFLLLARGGQLAQELGLSVAGGKSVGAIFIVLGTVGSIALVLSALASTP